jgi:hypothetical protein
VQSTKILALIASATNGLLRSRPGYSQNHDLSRGGRFGDSASTCPGADGLKQRLHLGVVRVAHSEHDLVALGGPSFAQGPADIARTNDAQFHDLLLRKKLSG